MRFSPFLAAALSGFALACGTECRDTEPTAGVPANLADPDAPGGFLAHPWPSDARRYSDGRLKLSSFPNPTQSSTLKDYLDAITQHTKGYSRNGAIFFGLDGALDPSSLPSTAMGAATATSTLQLVDVDPRSPEYGRRRPLWTWFRAKKTVYLPDNHLIALPPYGLELRDDTTYALIGTTGLRAADGKPLVQPKDFHNAIRATCAKQAPASLATLFAPLRAYLADKQLEPASVAFATVFTTGNVVAEMRKIADAARALPVIQLNDLMSEGTEDAFHKVAGTVNMPSFQAGTVPFYKPEDGGGINWGPDGVPQVAHTELTRVAFAIPRGIAMPAGGWPVLIFADGTGADYTSAYSAEIAGVLAPKGIAVVSYDPSLHGPRDPTNGGDETKFFNIFNIVAGRDNTRQGGVDLTLMTRLMKSGLELPDSVVGEGPARFDPNRVAFLGHSQGGLCGSPFVASEPGIKAAVFSGTSGVMTITLRDRKSPLDFAGLIRTLLALPPEEPLDETSPVLNLVQTFIEPSDPIAYGATYATDPPMGARRDILFVEGFKDFDSPAKGHEALATAVGAPLISPFYRVPYGQLLTGLAPERAPVGENVDTPDGKVTIGLIQYPDQTHFPIFRDRDANGRFAEFIRSALLDGRGRIIPSQYE